MSDGALKGFTMIPNEVLLDTRLSAQARLLYGLLRYHARQKDECWPGLETLAAELDLSTRSVFKYLWELVEAGLLAKRRGGNGRANVYVLMASRSEAEFRSEASRPEAEFRSRPEQIGSTVPVQIGSRLPTKNKNGRREEGKI